MAVIEWCFYREHMGVGKLSLVREGGRDVQVKEC